LKLGNSKKLNLILFLLVRWGKFNAALRARDEAFAKR
jgi:hypothetical protein